MTQLHKRLSLALMAAYFSGMVACSTMQVKTAQDPAANLSAYKTFAWAPPSPTQSPKTTSSILDETVQADVRKELISRGLQQAPPEMADIWISYTAVTKEQMNYGMSPGPWLWGPDEYVYPTRVGSLTLQFIDPKTNRTVWQGTASDAVGNAGASQKDVASAVQDLLKKYPVKPVA